MTRNDVLTALGIGVLGGAAVAVLGPGGLFSLGWLGAGVLLAMSWLLLLWAWRCAGAGRLLLVLAVAAFVLRLGVGVALSLALPVLGDGKTETQLAGYVFFDAYHRDEQAWTLAQSGQPLSLAFGEQLYMDQYGGLLWLSAVVYRLLSPDMHRPILVVILGAFTAALGVIFLYRATRLRFSAAVAAAAGWIYALYPESVLQGASQMREPFLMGLSAIGFWAVLGWRSAKDRVWLVAAGVFSLMAMALISWRAALPVAGVLVIWFWLDNMFERPGKLWKSVFWGGLAVAMVAGAVFSWEWLRDAAAWDAILTQQSSGMIQLVIAKLPEVMRGPFLAVYGLTQPVLPAALFENALPIHRAISSWRAVGWYMMVPLLLYAVFAVWGAARSDRSVLVLTLAASLLWVLISSARAGGDLWDNPRYRTIFIVWLALLCGWAWEWARKNRFVWLGRWVVVEGIFLVFFAQWYLSRYFHWGNKLPFFVMIGLIVGLGIVFMAACLGWDYLRARRKAV